jgi:hypothetical protein
MVFVELSKCLVFVLVAVLFTALVGSDKEVLMLLTALANY